MEAIDDLRKEIKSYFPESSELQLSSSYAQHRRFNFYFEIKKDYAFLLYLNWDGDSDRFTLKCLEFSDPQTLDALIAAYPQSGARTFNIGNPRSAVSFIYLAQNRLRVTERRGVINATDESGEISGNQLIRCIDPILQ